MRSKQKQQTRRQVRSGMDVSESGEEAKVQVKVMLLEAIMRDSLPKEENAAPR